MAEVEEVEEKILYHRTVTRSYKTAFELGQGVKIGSAHNPFFGFFEKPRTYPLVRRDRSVEQLGPILFLKCVDAGNIQANNLSRDALEIAQYFNTLAREFLMEHIRVTEFAGKPPSRQTCLFACDTLEEAKYWDSKMSAGSDEKGILCELTCNGIIFRADATWLRIESDGLSSSIACARAYWRGEVSDYPQMETLFIGEATVTELVE
ncbi:MAG: DUF2441 domain-containing protein [Hyphomicrobiaceae bacterium]|nr:DUF2441 domain-containing protein [Hyphomicrobiaceae bacterium]